MPAFVWICLLACLPLFLASCFGGDDEATVDLNIAQLIPADWTTVGELTQIDIDDDPVQEYLLLYTYDNGQMGAVIYDPQLAGDFLGLPEPPSGENPPSSLLVPYRILPSYWANSGQGGDTTPGTGVGPGASALRLMMGQGFIAGPGAAASVTPAAVQRGIGGAPGPGAVVATATPAPAGTPETKADELLLQGDGQHMTFAWWRNAQAGYGVTQIFAPGGLEIMERVDAGAENGAIQSVKGLYPYHDRSLLCREYTFTRTLSDTTPEQSFRPDIVFTPSDQGIVFCNTAPAYPFYPEGVVLAFIKAPGTEPALASPEVVQQMQTLLAGLPSASVADLQTAASLPVLESHASTLGQPVITTVCADLASGDQVRRLLFTLQHQPPTLSGPNAATSDRLLITRMDDVSAASQTTTCAELVVQTPPGTQ